MFKKQFLIFILLFFIVSCTNSNTLGDEISATQIIKLINKNQNILIIDKTIKGDLDFTKIKNTYARSQHIVVADINSSVTFINCKFEGNIIGFSVNENKSAIITIFKKNLTFTDCEFNGEINLRQNEIKGPVDFSKSIFNKKVSMEGITFWHSDNHFNNTTFNDEVKFSSSTFYGKTTFMESVFKTTTSFSKCFFMQKVNFGVCNFYGYTNFYHLNCNAQFTANYAIFHDEVYFNNSQFYNKTDFVEIFSKKSINFTDVVFYSNTKFNNSTFNNIVIFKNTIFITKKPDLDKISIQKGTNFVLDNCYFLSNIKLEKTDF